MNRYVLYFHEVNQSNLAEAGGKGANLGELSRVPGIAVPPGFCVTTKAYRDFVRTSGEFAVLLHKLESIDPASPEALKAAGQSIRTHLETLDIPAPIRQEIIRAWRRTGSRYAYAVRSSATAEDLPGASFAGQQDTFLNVRGEEQIISCVRKCWASLFTDRAIAYRREHGFAHAQVWLAVVVQRMVFPAVSGIMFTADPVTGNRKVVSIDASFGLGEALVSGIVSADLYQVKSDRLIKKQIARKEIAVFAGPAGGTVRTSLTGEKQTAQVLPDEDALRLARLGREIERYFGCPQDIEWCLAGDEIYIVQSRPITALYPVPASSDEQLRLYISIGHLQMMTEAMKPLGISVLRSIIPFGKSAPLAESDLLQEAGGRLYTDVVTRLLAYPRLKKILPLILQNVDEMMGRVVQEYIDRQESGAAAGPGKKLPLALVKKVLPVALAVFANILYRDQHRAFDRLNSFIAGQVKENREKLQAVSGVDRITQAQAILSALMPKIFTLIPQYLGTAMLTYKLIGHLSQRWLGDTAELGGISKSPPGNVTTEMGLALGDLADALRDHPAVIACLERAVDETFFQDLRAVPGGENVLPVFLDFFERYGMRGTGEIDVTRPRWREAPTQLVPALLSHIRSNRPGQHRLDFLAGREDAAQAAARLQARLRQKPLGLLKARLVRRLIKVHRSLIGLREHPKYYLVQHFDLVKQAILQEAAALVDAGILEHPEEVFWLSLQEVKEVIATRRCDRNVINRRKEKFRQEEKLTPPRAITSEGEIITVRPGAGAPPGALAGSAVSAGTVTGRARVILKLEQAKIEKGDILVAPYTDPAWTPLFPLAGGLVTEVGGLMTHGAVVAREYGIPAVVGVERATRRIRDGQQIRVDGNRGFVEILF